MTRKARLSLGFLLAMVFGAGAYGAFLFQRHTQVVAAIPARPKLDDWPREFSAALSAAESEAKSFFAPVPGLAELARLYRGNGLDAPALVTLQGLAKLAPKDPAWPYFIAATLASTGQLEEASGWQARAVALAPANALCHVRLGDMLLKLNREAEAEASFAKALALEPANIFAEIGLARCRMARGDLARAREILSQATEHQPDSGSAWAMLADVSEQLGDPAAAEAARRAARNAQRFREAPDPWPIDPLRYCYSAYRLSVAAATEPDRVEARRELERAIQLSPADSSYHRQIAKLLLSDRDVSGARSHLETAVKLVPTDSESWSQLVALLLKQGDPAAADQAIDRGLSFCPLSSYLHFIKGTRLSAAKRLDLAENEFLEAKKLQPNEARAHVQLAVIYVEQSRTNDALAELAAAHGVEPTNASVVVLLTRLNILLGDATSAQKWLSVLRPLPQTLANDIPDLEKLYREQFHEDPR